MEQYKQEFIEFMIRSGVLMFGDFVTKSGRKTPFFVNTGKYETGEQMARLGQFYAKSLIAALGDAMDVLYGPAYKGIPLAVTTAVSLSRDFGRNVPFAFNRKEAKDHGEGGTVIGHKLREGERVVIVEDVITAGTSIRESVALINSLAAVKYAGVIVSVDRMEKGTGEKSALQEVRDTYGMPVFPIVTLAEVVSHLHNRRVDGNVVIDDAMKGRIDEYRAKYGVGG
jgi:orotate phosphoribosyltransferase